MVSLLLAAKADSTVTDEFGNSALHLAALFGHVGVLRALVDEHNFGTSFWILFVSFHCVRVCVCSKIARLLAFDVPGLRRRDGPGSDMPLVPSDASSHQWSC